VTLVSENFGDFPREVSVVNLGEDATVARGQAPTEIFYYIDTEYIPSQLSKLSYRWRWRAVVVTEYVPLQLPCVYLICLNA